MNVGFSNTSEWPPGKAGASGGLPQPFRSRAIKSTVPRPAPLADGPILTAPKRPCLEAWLSGPFGRPTHFAGPKPPPYRRLALCVSLALSVARSLAVKSRKHCCCAQRAIDPMVRFDQATYANSRAGNAGSPKAPAAALNLLACLEYFGSLFIVVRTRSGGDTGMRMRAIASDGGWAIRFRWHWAEHCSARAGWRMERLGIRPAGRVQPRNL